MLKPYLKIIIIILLVVFTFTACGLIDFDDSIVGKWKGKNPGDGFLIFKNNGELDILDENENSAIKAMMKDIANYKVKYEEIKEVEPNQLYIIFVNEGKTHRAPLGIFKIENGKLVLREAIEYHRTVGGFDMGVSRYEMPKDFSGLIKVYEKI